MILLLYREEVAAAAAAVAAAVGKDSAVALHFRYILRKMEQKELLAVAVREP